MFMPQEPLNRYSSFFLVGQQTGKEPPKRMETKLFDLGSSAKFWHKEL